MKIIDKIKIYFNPNFNEWLNKIQFDLSKELEKEGTKEALFFVLEVLPKRELRVGELF